MRTSLSPAFVEALEPRELFSATFPNGTQNSLVTGGDGTLYLAYYDNSAHNLKYARRSAAGVWGATQTVDSSSANTGNWPSITLDNSGNPAIAYYDATNGDLKYADFNGTSWSIQTVDSTNTTGYYPCLKFIHGSPYISYYYATGGDLRLASNVSGSWTTSTVESQGDQGRYSSMDGYFITAGSTRVSIAYEDTTDGWFRFADSFDGGGTWAKTTVDSTTRNGGGYISFAYGHDSSNLSVVTSNFTYYDAYNADLKFATDDGGWKVQTLASHNSVGLYSTLHMDGGNPGNVLITYYNQTGDTAQELQGVTSGLAGFTQTSSGTLLSGGGSNMFSVINPVNSNIIFTDNRSGSTSLFLEN